MPKGVSIRPSDAVTASLADLCFEDAIEAGRKINEGLKSIDFRETSIRFCVDGLRKWCSSYAKNHYDGSLFTLLQSGCWHWASFCETDPTLIGVRTEYFKLLREITEKTSYTDLADRLDEYSRIKLAGWRSKPMNVVLPIKAAGVVSECAASLGLPFSLFFQVGLGWSLSCSKKVEYRNWVDDIFHPLFDEIMVLANKRSRSFREVEAVLFLRASEKSQLNINESKNRS